MESQLRSRSIPFEFFDALDGNQARAAIVALGLQIEEGSLSSGELGCFMSHVLLWKKLLDSDAQTMTIVEDDIFLGKDAHLFLTTNEWIPTPASERVVKLEKYHDKVLLGRGKWPAGGGRQLRLLRQDHWGTAAYVIGRDAAARLMEYLKSGPICRSIDHFVFDTFRQKYPESVLQLVPAMAIQEKVLLTQGVLGSQLEAQRLEKMSFKEVPRPGLERLLLSKYWQKKWHKFQVKYLSIRLDFS